MPVADREAYRNVAASPNPGDPAEQTRGSRGAALKGGANIKVYSGRNLNMKPSGAPSEDNLPDVAKQPPVPIGFAPASDQAGFATILTAMARRKRKRACLAGVKLTAFVVLPTLLTAAYFQYIATPMYSSYADFVIQQSGSETPATQGFGGMFAGATGAGSQDAVSVQSFLKSRDAFNLLNRQHQFAEHFKGAHIDPFNRLTDESALEDAYELYTQKVKIGYDPSEGLIHLEAISPDPVTSEVFAKALVGYAEAKIDELTLRLRTDQVQSATAAFQEAQRSFREAQSKVIDVQERFEILSAEAEANIVSTQLSGLEGDLSEARLALDALLKNSQPNATRVDIVQERVLDLEAEIARRRASLSVVRGTGSSAARMQAELKIATTELESRAALLSQSLQQLEAARAEAGRQVRYLALVASPVAADKPSYPRTLEHTGVALITFILCYLMITLSVSSLREQLQV